MPKAHGDANWIVEGELLLAFFPAGPVDEQVWSRLCGLIATPEVKLGLLASIGAMELDGSQRGELSEALCVGQGARLAVVSDEALVRGTMTAMSWRRRVELRLFIWHKLREAHAYLEPPGIDAKQLSARLEELRRQLEAGEPTQ